MVKYFLIALASLFMISKNSKVKKYNVEETFFTRNIELSDKTACVCFKLDNLNNNSIFHLKENCDDTNSKIDTTLYYNYIESCDSKTTCDEIYLNNYLENNDRTIEIDNKAGFVYEYKFVYKDESRKAILVQYKNFEGEKLIMQRLQVNSRIGVITVFGILLGLYSFVNILIAFLIYKWQKE